MLELWKSVRVSCTVIAILIGSSASADADVIYTVTATGFITAGTDQGVFGAVGNPFDSNDLVGQSFSILETFESAATPTPNICTQTAQECGQYLEPVNGSAIITVKGVSYNIDGQGSSYNALSVSDTLHLNQGYYYPSDELLGEIGIQNSNFTQIYILSNTTDFLSSDNLYQTLSYSPSGILAQRAYFQAPDYSAFYGTVQTVTLQSTPLPEPSSFGDFCVALLFVFIARRYKKCSVPTRPYGDR